MGESYGCPLGSCLYQCRLWVGSSVDWGAISTGSESSSDAHLRDCPISYRLWHSLVSQEKRLSRRSYLVALFDSGWIDAVLGGVLARQSCRGSGYDGIPMDKHCFGSLRSMADPETAPANGCLIGQEQKTH